MNKDEKIISNLLELFKNDVHFLKAFNDIRDKVDKEHLEKIESTFLSLFVNKGTNFGEAFEMEIKNIFNDLSGKTRKSYDGVFFHRNKNIKIEIKGIRAIDDKQKGEDYEKRAICYDDYISKKRKISNHSFQQIKPSCFDILICGFVCLDRIDLYVIPANDFSETVISKENKNLTIKDNEKLHLSGQHKNNSTEGQIIVSKIKKYNVAYLMKVDKETKCFLTKNNKEINSLKELVELYI